MAIIADQHLAQLLIITSSPALFHKQPQPWASRNPSDRHPPAARSGARWTG